MEAERRLREKLRKIEALFAGAATVGEKAAAGAAAERIRRQFAETSEREKSEEFKFSIPDPWSRQLFTALCRRYGVRPFRYGRATDRRIVRVTSIMAADIRGRGQRDRLGAYSHRSLFWLSACDELHATALFFGVRQCHPDLTNFGSMISLLRETSLFRIRTAVGERVLLLR